jgi:hypothetical protein
MASTWAKMMVTAEVDRAQPLLVMVSEAIPRVASALANMLALLLPMKRATWSSLLAVTASETRTRSRDKLGKVSM